MQMSNEKPHSGLIKSVPIPVQSLYQNAPFGAPNWQMFVKPVKNIL